MKNKKNINHMMCIGDNLLQSTYANLSNDNAILKLKPCLQMIQCIWNQVMTEKVCNNISYLYNSKWE